MSLSKLFNYKYLLQNIKKSRMTIALFFIIVPIFTSLIIIAADQYTFEFESLASVNIIGMYLIPFIFSICLFGFVFKKNSVDFMGSMPISRKCVFITNTIGGSALILLMQLVTFFLTILLGTFTKGIIFTSMAWDVLVYQTFAYIFVFVCANLAMSLSGTLITQIAVTMLIVFVVPFSTWFINGVSGNPYMLVNGEVEMMDVTKVQSYTAPFLIANDGMYQYNGLSLIKMIILSIVYFIIGLYAFEKRKMEVAGESFENKYVHFIVKGLTLLPFVAILKEVGAYESFTVVTIIFTIILVYYFVFDLITSKKVKILENLISLVVCVATIYGFYSIAIGINESITKKVELESIKSVNINVDNLFYARVSNKNEIKTLIPKISRSSGNYNYYDDFRYWTEITFTKYDGTKYKNRVYIGEKAFNDLFSDSYKNVLYGSKTIITNERVKLTEKESSEILKALNETLQKTSLSEIINRKVYSYYGDVTLSEYKNHELISIRYPITLNNDVQKIMVKAYNRYAVNSLNKGMSRLYYTVNSYDKFNDEMREKVWFAIDRVKNEISEFIISNADVVPENIEDCISISTNSFIFYTDKIDEFIKLINKICEDNKEEFEQYKNGYSKTYYYDDVEYDNDLKDTVNIKEEDSEVSNESELSGEGLQLKFLNNAI